MKRRGFLAAFGLSGAAITASAMGASVPDDSKGFTWEFRCTNERCKEPLSYFVDMRGPVHIPNQCPRCLDVIAFQDGKLAQAIKQWNLKNGRKTTIHTPASFRNV